MIIKIINRFTPDGKVFFEWYLWDGPDGIEEVHGYAADLITAFSKIMEWRERIAADYTAETLETITQHNETDPGSTD
jgi:hypothetical protein